MSDIDIVDRIDQLVDEQLANYDNRSGYDHNIQQDKCPHCDMDWHGLAITARIAIMKITGYDEAYSYAEDDSPVLCPGSQHDGPVPADILENREKLAESVAPITDALLDNLFNPVARLSLDTTFESIFGAFNTLMGGNND